MNTKKERIKRKRNTSPLRKRMFTIYDVEEGNETDGGGRGLRISKGSTLSDYLKAKSNRKRPKNSVVKCNLYTRQEGFTIVNTKTLETIYTVKEKIFKGIVYRLYIELNMHGYKEYMQIGTLQPCFIDDIAEYKNLKLKPFNPNGEFKIRYELSHNTIQSLPVLIECMNLMEEI